MIIESLTVGFFETNCYILGKRETGDAAIIDPGDEEARILKRIEEQGLNPLCIINTHGHVDHIGATRSLAERLKNIKVYIHEADAQMLTGLETDALFFLKDGDSISAGGLRFKIIHTPGHTPGGISLLINGHLFSGDSLFCGSIGRTDLPGGSTKQLLRGLKEKILTLPGKTIVHPGHGPASTIEDEKLSNPFLS
ncbi:MAG: Hydroxyacylglutathione hydrolase GloC [Firmicutes bacterium]|nr:Hydroxyacylglutathione hydrolase GloC [Bacillota bacterium]